MVSVIADILKSQLTDLDWIERFGGLVVPATRAVTTQGADGAMVVTGYQSYPVACDVNVENCWESGKFKHFEPDSSKSAIAYFVDNGGAALQAIEGPKNAYLKCSFDIRFLCWMNLKRLGEQITDSSCYASGRVVPYVIAQFMNAGSNIAFTAAQIEAVFGVGYIQASAFQEVQVTGFRQLRREPSMFAPFTFATDGEKRGLFIWPYDYFGIQLTGTYVVNRNCLADLYTPPFVATAAACLPGDEDVFLTTESGAFLTSEEEEVIIEE